jgi:hypothetical protein
MSDSLGSFLSWAHIGSLENARRLMKNMPNNPPRIKTPVKLSQVISLPPFYFVPELIIGRFWI